LSIALSHCLALSYAVAAHDVHVPDSYALHSHCKIHHHASNACLSDFSTLQSMKPGESLDIKRFI
jgi:hypothetical protein